MFISNTLHNVVQLKFLYLKLKSMNLQCEVTVLFCCCVPVLSAQLIFRFKLVVLILLNESAIVTNTQDFE